MLDISNIKWWLESLKWMWTKLAWKSMKIEQESGGFRSYNTENILGQNSKLPIVRNFETLVPTFLRIGSSSNSPKEQLWSNSRSEAAASFPADPSFQIQGFMKFPSWETADILWSRCNGIRSLRTIPHRWNSDFHSLTQIVKYTIDDMVQLQAQNADNCPLRSTTFGILCGRDLRIFEDFKVQESKNLTVSDTVWTWFPTSSWISWKVPGHEWHWRGSCRLNKVQPERTKTIW